MPQTVPTTIASSEPLPTINNNNINQRDMNNKISDVKKIEIDHDPYDPYQEYEDDTDYTNYKPKVRKFKERRAK